MTILAQTDIIQAFSSFYAEAGAIGATFLILFLIVLIFLLVWRKYQNAKIDRQNERQKAETQRLQEYNAQTALINEFARKATEAERELSEKLFVVQKEQGIAEGRIIEMGTQMRHDREKYEGKQKELEEKISNLSKQFQDSQTQIEALTNALESKNKEIAYLIIERDTARQQVADEKAMRERIESNLADVMKGRDFDKSKLKEQEEQIKVLSYELAALLPLPPPEKPPTLDDTIELKPEDLADDSTRTLDNPITQAIPIDNENKNEKDAA